MLIKESFEFPKGKGSNALSYSRAIARQLGLQEKDIYRLLAGTKLTVENFIYGDKSLSNAEQFQVFRNTLSISNDPSFGLRLGKTLTPPAHGAMGFLANCSPTLLSALEDFSSFLPIRVGFGRLELVRGDTTMQAVMHVLYTQDAGVYRMISEAFAISLLTLIEYVLGKPFESGAVFFSYSKPDYHHQYSANFHCPIQFDAPVNLLEIPIDLLDTLNAAADLKTYQHSLDQCKRLLNDIGKNSDSAQLRVQKLLATPGEQPSEDEVAAAMFISKRTLGRRLADEGTSFRQIREDVLASLARGYLSDTKLAIDTIARILNFHDSSSFRRAFRRQHNMSPVEYRQQSQLKINQQTDR